MQKGSTPNRWRYILAGFYYTDVDIFQQGYIPQVQIYCSPVILHRCRHIAAQGKISWYTAAELHSTGEDSWYTSAELHSAGEDLLVYSSRVTLYRGRFPGIQHQSYTLQGKISWYTAAELLFIYIFFVLRRAVLILLLYTVSGCDGRNRTPIIAVNTWRLKPLIYGHHPLSYGRHPLSYGCHPLSYGQHPLSYGRHPTAG